MESKRENNFYDKGRNKCLNIPLVRIRKRKDILQIGLSSQIHQDTASLLQDNETKKIFASVFKYEYNKTFQIDSKSIEKAMNFIGENIENPFKNTIICVGEQLFKKDVIKRFSVYLKSVIKDNSKLIFHPISPKLVGAFYNYVYEHNPSIENIGYFSSYLACNDLLRFFIHSPGMAHSAQDVISYLKLYSQYVGTSDFSNSPFDMVNASIPQGMEWFVIQCTPDTPSRPDIASIGFSYFSIFNKYKTISLPLGAKLALINCSRQLNLLFGYTIKFDKELLKGKKYET